jgi:hypothetical protein
MRVRIEIRNPPLELTGLVSCISGERDQPWPAASAHRESAIKYPRSLMAVESDWEQPNSGG